MSWRLFFSRPGWRWSVPRSTSRSGHQVCGSDCDGSSQNGPRNRISYGTAEGRSHIPGRNHNQGHSGKAFGVSLNYIKQLGLKDNLCLKRGFSMETLCPHEYDIPLVRGGHLEGPHVFGFLIHVFPFWDMDPNIIGNYGLENCIFQSEWCSFAEF